MDAYVDPREQLVVELYVRDIKKSMQFYIDFGFEVVRDDGDFVVLRWEEAQLYIEEVRDAPIPEYPVGNIRIMVPDVDRYWEMAERLTPDSRRWAALNSHQSAARVRRHAPMA